MSRCGCTTSNDGSFVEQKALVTWASFGLVDYFGEQASGLLFVENAVLAWTRASGGAGGCTVDGAGATLCLRPPSAVRWRSATLLLVVASYLATASVLGTDIGCLFFAKHETYNNPYNNPYSAPEIDHPGRSAQVKTSSYLFADLVLK